MQWKLYSAATIALFTSHAFAADLSYTFVEAGYAQIDDDGIDASGVGAGASFAMTENLFLTLGYASAETDDEFTTIAGTTDEIEVEGKSIGLGYNGAIGKKTDLVIGFSYTDVEAEFAGSEDDSSVKAFSLGVRSMVAERLELNGGIFFQSTDNGGNTDDTDAGFGIGARGYLTDAFSIGLDYSTIDEADIISGSLRLSF